MKSGNWCALIALVLACNALPAQGDSLRLLASGIPSNLRGVSIAPDQSIWVSGSNGYIGRAASPHSQWHFFHIPDFETAELRDIHAFDSLRAIALSCTQPAAILKTYDGGQHWKICYASADTNVFLDDFDFWSNGRGICLGDPVSNTFLILSTTDSGDTWREAAIENRPIVPDSTYAFAASGSAMQCVADGEVFFGTGGKEALLYSSTDYGTTWKHEQTPMLSGTASTGIFSVDISDAKYACITGGDYAKADQAFHNFYFRRRNGKWKAATIPPQGYMSCVKRIPGDKVITCGTNGVAIANTGEFRFEKISGEVYNTIACNFSHGLVILAGSNGKIAVLNY